MARAFGFCVLFMVVGTAFILLAFSSGYSFNDMVFHGYGDGNMVISHSRKLKEKSYIATSGKKSKGTDSMNLEDYHPIDPAPSSKAAIRTGPIEHGTPVMPFIPKPPPPDRPSYYASPPT